MHHLLAALSFFFVLALHTLAAYARKPIQLDLHAPAFTARAARRQGQFRRAAVQNATLAQHQETNLDKLFFATLGIGTPPQLINVTIDLISSDLIIPSNVTFCAGCGFVVGKSSSAVNESRTTVIRRTNGQPNGIPITGSIFIDVVALEQVQVPVVQFLVAEDIDGGIPAGFEHGFLGLGGTSLSTLDSTPPWQNLLGSNNLRPEFGLWLSRDGTGRAGSFFLGGHDTSVYSGAIDLLPVTGQASAFWTLNVTGLSAQGSAISIPAGGQIAQFDMNNAAIMAPQAVVDAFWAKVPGATVNGAGSYLFPCGTNVEFSITFGGRVWTMPASDMALEDLGGGDCLGSLIGFSSTTANQWVIGFQFLKNFYTAYQTTPPMIGIADLSTLAGGKGQPNSTAPIPTSSSVSGSSSRSVTIAGGRPTGSAPPPASHAAAAPTAAIAGGVVGGVVLLAALLLVLFFLRRRQRQRPDNLEADLGHAFSPQENMTISPFSSPSRTTPPMTMTGLSGSLSPSSPDEKRAMVLGLAGRSRSGTQSSASPSASGSGSGSRRNPSIARSGTGRDDSVALRNELQHLRQEVQHWQAVAETVPPPSYFDGPPEEDARR